MKASQPVKEDKIMEQIIKIVETVARVDQKTDDLGSKVDAVDKKLDEVKISINQKIDAKFGTYDNFILDAAKDSGKNKNFRTGVSTILALFGTGIIAYITYVLTNGNLFGG